MILLDTNIISFLLKKDSRIEGYKPYLDNQIWAICLMNVAELYQWGVKRIQQMESWMHDNFDILLFDTETSRLWAEVTNQRRARGQPISVQDAWIAAAALQHDIPLVTHNPTDFEMITGLEIITTIPTL